MHEKTAYAAAVIYALICAAEDIRTRRINNGVSIIFAAAGAVMCLLGQRSAEDIVFSLLPGAVILILSLLSGGCIGIGDAVFSCVCALYMSAGHILGATAAAWLMCAAAALIMIASGQVRRETAGKGLPFTAYMLLPVIIAAVSVWIK